MLPAACPARATKLFKCASCRWLGRAWQGSLILLLTAGVPLLLGAEKAPTLPLLSFLLNIVTAYAGAAYASRGERVPRKDPQEREIAMVVPWNGVGRLSAEVLGDRP